MNTPTTSLDFSVTSKENAPEIPLAKGNKESPLSSALKELPRGGFIHIHSIDAITRKRVSDMCSRLKRLSGGERVFILRKITFQGVNGLGIWRTDGDPGGVPLARAVASIGELPQLAKKQTDENPHAMPKARAVASTGEVPRPTREQRMAGR